MAIIDSYSLFVEYFSQFSFSEESFLNWGLDNILFTDKEKAEKEWENIKEKWYSNKDLWIRNSGRNGQSSKLYTDFYAQLSKTVSFDKTNNDIPAKIIQGVTGYVKYNSKSHDKITSKNAALNILRNYQVSHIWGHTKNPLLFMAPWNICFVPKMFDPFTGHEAKGPLVDKFQKQFKDKAKNIYSDLIADYNDFIEKEVINIGVIDNYLHIVENAYKNGCLTKRTFDDFQKNIKEEFVKI